MLPAAARTSSSNQPVSFLGPVAQVRKRPIRKQQRGYKCPSCASRWVASKPEKRGDTFGVHDIDPDVDFFFCSEPELEDLRVT